MPVLLKRGQRLPMVAAAQVLLNRRVEGEDPLTVDGIFGPKTESTVREFQRVMGLTQTGVVRADSWFRLGWLAGLRVVDSVDATEPEDASRELGCLRRQGGKVVANYGASVGLPHAVRKIRAAAGKKSVVLLRFQGHGSPGAVSVTDGMGTRDVVTLGSSLEYEGPHSEVYFRAQLRQLAPLKPIFHSFASIEFHGCRTGAGRYGRRLLQGVSEALGVPVTAGVKTQYTGGDSTLVFEGPVRTAFPGPLNLRSWAAALAPEEAMCRA